MDIQNDEKVFLNGLTGLLPRLVRYARVLAPTVPDADDLLQMTCERALTRRQQFNSGTRLDAWTFRIMSSIWKNELRSRAIRQGQGFVDADSLESRVGNHQQGNIFLHQVLEKIMGLPENQRETVLLTYVEGYSYEETAQILEVAPGTVMSRLSRARLALSDELAPRHQPGKTG